MARAQRLPRLGAHPLYHLLTGIAGIRPAADGFTAAEIAPQFGPLACIKATMPTPKGPISLDLSREGDAVSGSATIPNSLPSTFVWRGHSLKLKHGANRIDLAPRLKRFRRE